MMTIDEIQAKVRMNNFHNNLNTDGIILDVIRSPNRTHRLNLTNLRLSPGDSGAAMEGLGMTSADEHCDNEYQLDCGRWVAIEECYISTSMLGYLAGSPENPRVIHRVIEKLPDRIEAQLGGSTPHYIKPLPEGKSLPGFVFMVFLVSEAISDQEARYDGSPVIDPISGQPVRHYDGSKLIVCWLSDDITTSLPELVKRETRAIEWNKYAVDFSY